MQKTDWSHCKETSTPGLKAHVLQHFTFQERNRILTSDCFTNTAALPPWNTSLEEPKDDRYNTTITRRIKNKYSHFQTPGWIPAKPSHGKAISNAPKNLVQQSFKIRIILKLFFQVQIRINKTAPISIPELEPREGSRIIRLSQTLRHPKESQLVP